MKMRVCGLWDASLISHSQVNTSTALWSPQRDLPKSFLPTHSQLWFWPHFWENDLSYFPSRFLFSHPVQRGSNYKDKLMLQLACRFLLRKSQILCEVFKALHVWLPESSLAWTMSFKPADRSHSWVKFFKNLFLSIIIFHMDCYRTSLLPVLIPSLDSLHNC